MEEAAGLGWLGDGWRRWKGEGSKGEGDEGWKGGKGGEVMGGRLGAVHKLRNAFYVRFRTSLKHICNIFLTTPINITLCSV